MPYNSKTENNKGLTGISVNIELNKKMYKAEDREILEFTLTNNSDDIVSVLKWKTPLDGINSDMFRVEKEGEKSVYLGRIVKRAPPKPEDYVRLGSGESVSQEIDLTKFYDIADTGDYNIQFISPLLDVGTERPEKLAEDFAVRRDMTPKTVRSNVIEFKLLESRAPKQSEGIALDWLEEKKAAAEIIGPTFRNCTSNRQEILKEALVEAMNMSNEAKLSLLNTEENNRPHSIRNREWYGEYDNQRYAKVISNFEKIWDVTANKDITFNCDCDEGGNVYAYVFPTRPYEIFLCNLFWNAALTGTDSRAGTIIHELSHFDIVANTDDVFYGQNQCRQLAISDPAQTVSNADSHEYFAENNPPLTS